MPYTSRKERFDDESKVAMSWPAACSNVGDIRDVPAARGIGDRVHLQRINVGMEMHIFRARMI